MGHDKVGPTLIFADLVNRHYIRMVQLGGGLSFALEANPTRFILTQRRRQEFEGYFAIQFSILRQIHLTHPPGTNLGDDCVMRDLGTGD